MAESRSLANLLHDRAESDPDHVGIRTKKNGAWVDVTWKQIAERADHIAAGLLTATELADHDVIGILGQTSEDWITVDFAALSVGLQTVPIYASLLPEEVGYCHTDTKIKLVVVDDKDQLEKIRTMRDGFTFFDREYGKDEILLQHVVVIDPTGLSPADDWESLADVEKRGAEKLAEMREEMKRRNDDVDPAKTATYTYTSGTTGPPKAVIQTHLNHLAMTRGVRDTGVLDPGTLREGGLFLFLPLAHSFGRLIQFCGPDLDIPLVISSVPTLAQDLGETRPGFFPGAPRVYEKMKSKIESALAGATGVRKILANWALGVGQKTVDYKLANKPLPGFLAFQHTYADKLVLSKLRERLGFDRADALLSGSAPLDSEVHRFFFAMGLDLYEAYGLTETCPGLTANRPGHIQLGSVGQPINGVQIKIAEDGEILAKGANITSGYLNRPEATAAAFDDEGWFHTGDLGAMDDEGFVKITGRKKELIKTSGGKYVAPTKIEGRLKMLPIIQEAVVVGDRRKYCVALISIDPEEFEEWAKQNGHTADLSDADTKAAVQVAVDQKVAEVNSGLASFETIKYTRLLPEPLSIDNGLLTASLKVKRNIVEERYADLIDSMFQ